MGLFHVNGVIEAQTNTPPPTPLPVTPQIPIVPTWGAIITNTPSLQTATPRPDDDRTGCPEFDVNPNGLDDDWAAVCSRCIARLEPTAMVTLPSFAIGTVAPLGTNLAALPTIPPMYGTPTLGGIVPVPTATPPPAPTATAEVQDVYWDFRLDDYGIMAATYSAGLGSVEGACPVTDSGYPSGSWISGIGWKADNHVWGDGCGGRFLALQLPNYADLQQATMFNFAIYFDDVETFWRRRYSAFGGFDYAAPFETGAGDRGDWVNAWSDVTEPQIVDLRGLIIEVLGNAWPVVTGVSFSYIGQPFDYEDDEPTPTPPPTATPAGVVISCEEPLYKDIDTPIVDIDVSLADLGTDCYRIVPEIDSSSWEVVGIDLDIGLRVDGVDLCVEWLPFPILAFFGITIASDLLLIVPIAYMAKNLLWF